MKYMLIKRPKKYFMWRVGKLHESTFYGIGGFSIMAGDPPCQPFPKFCG